MTAPALLDVRNGIALVTINRPEMRNAIDLATAKRIAEIVDEIDSRTDIAVVIVRGAGSGFCSGLDLKAYARGEIGRIEGRGFAGFNEKPPTKPVIAAVEGFALAGGFELAITCDLIVIASDAKVGLPEVRRGLVPTAGGLLRLPRLLPPKIANELILTGRIVTAKELIGYGLFNSVVSPGAAADEARRLAAEMVANAPLAMAACKQVMREVDDWPQNEQFARQREITSSVFDSHDAKEGARAFVEKRKPIWRGC